MRLLPDQAGASAARLRRRRRPMKRALCMLLLTGCASFKTVLAPPNDLEDYRAYRVAAYRGTRLARAQKYLERHPAGTFADEVRAAFEEEEPRYFAEAQESRDG